VPEFADYYREIYARGMGGEQPALPVAVADLERKAVEAMDARAANYVCAGAGSEDTMDANREAFRRRRIVPRMLRDVAQRDLSATVLGIEMPAPVLLAPIGVQKIVHPDGELASAGAAAAIGLPYVTSTASAYSLEEIAKAGGDSPRWFQLYWTGEETIVASMVKRAEAAGYSAIVLTVDTFVPGWKPRDLQQAWLPFLEGTGTANFFEDPVFREALERPPEEDVGAAVGHYLSVYENPSLTWDRLSWLREQTSLPILVKGILHPDDAREAVSRGLDGIIVSNHGGRQIDGEIASLDALPPIADAVGGQIAVLLDSGIRGGSDVLKALALGADAVLLGRPYIWGLALGGRDGVEAVLKMLLAELDLTLALAGQTSVADIGPELLTRVPA
jgi:isopentenyl diphosphate isomerase/L-lactate dehydrogenase-like FMN-dependent dehydrogenase